MSPPIPFTVAPHKVALYWIKVNKTETCWLWTAGCDVGGYGAFNVGTRMVKAHLVAWTLERGEFPPGLEPDHTCEITACVNPDHLDWVTHAENMRRRKERSKYCLSGKHKWSEQLPIYVHDHRNGSVYRKCAMCQAENMKRLRPRYKVTDV